MTVKYFTELNYKLQNPQREVSRSWGTFIPSHPVYFLCVADVPL